VSATIRVTREGAGIELRRGRFEIVADGTIVGSFEWHETVEAPLEPGRHTLRIQAGRYSSRTHSFDAANEEVVNFRCHGAMIWPMYVASIVKPDLAISLKQE
jgi:ssDNA-binding replication factor A large subunit